MRKQQCVLACQNILDQRQSRLPEEVGLRCFWWENTGKRVIFERPVFAVTTRIGEPNLGG